MRFKKILIAVLAMLLIMSSLPMLASAASIKFEQGDQGDAVMAIQAVLKQEGYYKGSVDGKYGSGTIEAVKNFQKAKKLTQDGKAGQNTLTAMGLLSSAKAKSTAKTTAVVYLRKGPSTSHVSYYLMARGVALTIIGESGDWYKVRTGDGIEGYSSKQYVKADGQSAGNSDDTVYQGKVKNISNFLNIRAQKSASSESVGRLTNGSMVYVLDPNGTWLHIQTTTGIKGYCHSSYINVTQSSAKLPSDDVDIPTYTLKRGMNGNANVKKMQQRLKELGYFDANCTGNFASVTYNAVRAFQKRNSLTVDGIAGTKTLTAMYSSSAIAQSGQNAGSNGDDELLYPMPDKVLKSGMDSTDVQNMQTRLTELGYFSASCTGYFGSKTVTSVKNFQKKNNVSVDGLAGTKTLSAMYSKSAIANESSEDATLTKKIDAMIKHAKGYLGAKYVRGGNGPKSFDCSGLTTTVFKETMSYTLPRTAYTQGYNSFGRKITSMSNLKKGDLVFFDTSKNDGDLCDHVGIYIGNNQFIHASSSLNSVVIATITDRWWAEIFSWGKRVFE